MASNILKARDEMGLMPYPEQAGMLIGDVKFMYVSFISNKKLANTQTHGEECTEHVIRAGHPKKDGQKNWVCRGIGTFVVLDVSPSISTT